MFDIFSWLESALDTAVCHSVQSPARLCCLVTDHILRLIHTHLSVCFVVLGGFFEHTFAQLNTHTPLTCRPPPNLPLFPVRPKHHCTWTYTQSVTHHPHLCQAHTLSHRHTTPLIVTHTHTHTHAHRVLLVNNSFYRSVLLMPCTNDAHEYILSWFQPVWYINIYI